MLRWLCIAYLFFVAQAKAFDYCDPAVCRYQGTHVGCNNNGSFGPACFGELEMVNMIRYIELILDKHNDYRNELACGNLKGFEPAARMPALQWNEELAKHAELNVKTCKFAHDKCRSTSEYHYAGQNIYYSRSTNLNRSIEDYLLEGMHLWHVEYKDANAELMQSFKKTVPQTGHFTLLMNDRNTKVGCGALRNMQPPETPLKRPKRMFLWTCDYTSTNIQGYPSYKVGAPGLLCKKRHPKYNCLCADSDIDANNIFWYNEV